MLSAGDCAQLPGVAPDAALYTLIAVINQYMDDGVAHLKNAVARNCLSKVNFGHVSHRRRYCRVHCYTQECEWLDVLQFQFRSDGQGGCKVWARGSSSGLVPVNVPLAPLLNMMLFFAPFHDGVGCSARFWRPLRGRRLLPRPSLRSLLLAPGRPRSALLGSPTLQCPAHSLRVMALYPPTAGNSSQTRQD